MNCKRLVIVIIWAIILSSCGSATQPEITKVGIHVTPPPGDGYAYCEFTLDGWAEGGHLSGGPEPFVHRDRERLPRKQIEEIWAAAEAIDTQLYPLTTSAQRECVDCVDLFIYYSDEKIMHLSWPLEERHPDPKVQDLEALLYEYKIGGW